MSWETPNKKYKNKKSRNTFNREVWPGILESHREGFMADYAFFNPSVEGITDKEFITAREAHTKKCLASFERKHKQTYYKQWLAEHPEKEVAPMENKLDKETVAALSVIDNPFDVLEAM